MSSFCFLKCFMYALMWKIGPFFSLMGTRSAAKPLGSISATSATFSRMTIAPLASFASRWGSRLPKVLSLSFCVLFLLLYLMQFLCGPSERGRDEQADQVPLPHLARTEREHDETCPAQQRQGSRQGDHHGKSIQGLCDRLSFQFFCFLSRYRISPWSCKSSRRKS